MVTISAHTRQCKGGEFPDWGTSGLSELLFGDLWSFDEYCGHYQTGPRKAQDDYVHQAFYNGSALKSILSAGQPEELHRAVNQAILDGIRARNSLAIICSIRSWGYADESSHRLSITDSDNPRDCLSALARILGSLRQLAIKNDPNRHSISLGNRRIPSIDRLEVDSSIQDSCINTSRLSRDWLQVSTFGRINQGFPFDSHILLGDYNACKRLPQTRYCFGALQSDSWRKTHRQGSDDYIRVGLCLPNECNPDSLPDMTSMVDRIFSEHNQGIRTNLLFDGHIKRIYCPPEDHSPLRDPFRDSMSILLIIAATIWIGTMAFVTLLKPFKPNNQREKRVSFLGGFDLKNNLRSFFQYRTETDGLAGLDFIKVMGTFWLISSHNLLIIIPYFRNAQDFRLTCNSSLVALIVLQSQHVVVVFFMISGFLVGYKYLHKNRSIESIKLIVARYARLAPLYLLIYAFVKKFAHLLSSGPLWDYGVSPESEIRQCMKESWLVPILMLANFIPPFAHCILTGWHIANDFHIFLLIPWLLKVYQRSRSRGRLIAIASFILSHLFHLWNYHQSDNFNFETLVQEPFTIGARAIMERLANDYVNPIGRFGTCFMGVLLADMIIERRASRKLAALVEANKMHEISMIQLDKVNSNRYKVAGYTNDPVRSRANQFGSRFLLVTAMLSILACLIAPAMPMSLKGILGSYSKSLSYPLVRIGNELGWFYILYHLLDNQNPKSGESPTAEKSELNQFPLFQPSRTSSLLKLIGLPIWEIAVKLNYTLVIIHFTLARYFVQSQIELIEFSWPNLLQIIVFNILVTYCVAFTIHLAIEVPLMSIVKKILVVFKIETSGRYSSFSKRLTDDSDSVRRDCRTNSSSKNLC